MRRVSSRSAVLVSGCLLVVFLTAASCGDRHTPLTVATATRGTVAEVVEAPGSVTARAAATLSAPADGTLASLRVQAGALVRKGQILAVIDSPAAQQRLRQATSALRQAPGAVVDTANTVDVAAVQRSTDAAARDAFASARDAAAKITDPAVRAAELALIDQSEQRYTAASNAVTRALRSLRQGLAGLDAAMNALISAQRLQAQQAYDLAAAGAQALTLRAPIAGVVQYGGTSAAATSALGDLIAGTGSVGGSATGTTAGSGASPPGADATLAEGAVVSAGMPLMTIVDTRQLGIVAEVDETDVLLVKPGKSANVQLEAATDASYPATVRSVDLLPVTSARGGVSYRVRLSIRGGTNADGSTAPTPRPGMSATARLQVREATQAITVPAAAIFSVDGHDAVWVVRDGRVQRAGVTVGVQGDDKVQILSGVDEGQQVVAGGTAKVRPGQPVR